MSNNEQNLGRLESVDLVKVWANEASDFTPWLAKDENISLLGDTIGLDLEVEAVEQAVGPFRADIVCRDTTNDHYVLIENQIQRTDHTHLGQLMTYAAGLDAATVVWIAKRFREEHRAALDWLNEITDTAFEFFGLEMELWRIGDSTVAPKFNLVSKPNEWTKGGSVGGGREKRSIRLEYWVAFRNLVKELAPQLKPGKATSGASLEFPIGRRNFEIIALTRKKTRRIGVALAVRCENADMAFQSLKDNQGDIEAALNMPVRWIDDSVRNIFRMQTEEEGYVDERGKWPDQHQWLLNTIQKYKEVFLPRVAALEIDLLDNEAPDDE